MKFARPNIGLPLLAKELIEQSARRRTYVLRVLYAAAFFVTVFLMFREILGGRAQSPFAVLGRGREMFETLVVLQFFGVYLFMPAMTCGVLTVEKERNSLELLFLTRLGPWTILFEKLLSRLVPMLSFLLLSLPLLAFAYSLGGVSTDYLWGGVYCLTISVLQVGALALMCSAFFRTTVGAFVGSYLIGLALFFTLPFLELAGLFPGEAIAEFLNGFLQDGRGPGRVVLLLRADDVAFVFFAPHLFLETAPQVPFGRLVMQSVPILVSSLAFLLLARVFVVRRAFVQPRNVLLKLFHRLDRLFWRLNERVARGIVLVRDGDSLPGIEPIAWRETAKKSLGTARYLIRVLVALEFPTAAVCLLMVSVSPTPQLEGAWLLVFLLWVLAALFVSVKSTSLIAGERSHQTLDVLLTTPMTGREIVLQKMQGVRRLIAVLLVPFLTVFLLETFWRAEFTGPDPFGQRSGRASAGWMAYFVVSVGTVLVYLPMFSWLSLLIGLRVRSQARAIIASLAAVVGWCVLPFLLLFVWEVTSSGPDGPGSGVMYGLLTSPATLVIVNEVNAYRSVFGAVFAPILVNFLLYGAILYALRQTCLLNADRWLGRNWPGRLADPPEGRIFEPHYPHRSASGPPSQAKEVES